MMCFGNNLSIEPVTPKKLYKIARVALNSGELELSSLKSNYHFIKSFVAKHLTN